MNGIDSIAGFRVVTTPLATQPRKRTMPVFRLRPWAPVSDEFRAEFDQWLADLFGHERTEVVTRGTEPGMFLADRTIFVHPELLPKLREFAQGHVGRI